MEGTPMNVPSLNHCFHIDLEQVSELAIERAACRTEAAGHFVHLTDDHAIPHHVSAWVENETVESTFWGLLK
jgi:hypothetical protein